MSQCQTEACENAATAQGLCSRHYQERRRREKGVCTVRGPVPRYPQELRDKYQGAPHFNLRLDPEVFDWVAARGGVAWLRRILDLLKRYGTFTLGEEPVLASPVGKFHGASNANQFLDMLYTVYQLLARKPYGAVVTFHDLYNILTLLPHARQEYTLSTFAMDIYRLDHYPGITTKHGLHVRLHPGATAARRRENLLIMTTPQGEERTYYGIEFEKTPL
jgi:hypothetical protein